LNLLSLSKLLPKFVVWLNGTIPFKPFAASHYISIPSFFDT
jgi:hypothetical protein